MKHRDCMQDPVKTLESHTHYTFHSNKKFCDLCHNGELKRVRLSYAEVWWLPPKTTTSRKVNKNNNTTEQQHNNAVNGNEANSEH